MDDDVDTDDDVMESARHACARDFKDARHRVRRLGWNNITNNSDIRHRVSNPEYYDRTGKFVAYG